MATASAQPSKLRVWVMASRPKTLPASLTPVLVGGALAYGAKAFALLPFLAALFGACLIQIGTNLANDYFDFKHGADNADRLGPVRVTQQGLATPREVLWATTVAFGLAVLVGTYLVAVGGYPIVAIGLASILAGIAYTGGPFPLGYNGLGEVFVFLFFGLVAVLGTLYVQAHALMPVAWYVALPVGFLSSAINVVNNLRDIDTDRLAGKKTMAARFGARFTRIEYAALVLGSYLVVLALVALRMLHPLALSVLLTLPMAWKLNRSVHRDVGATLNKTLAGTGQLLLLFGILLSVGLMR